MWSSSTDETVSVRPFAEVESQTEHGRIAELESRLAAALAERDQAVAERDKLRQAYARLQEQFELLQRRIFVAKAERLDVTQLELEFAQTKAQLDTLEKLLEKAAGEDGESPPEKPKRPKPKGRRNLGSMTHLPDERVEITDPELEGVAEKIGHDESYRLGYRRGGPVRIVVARAKYKVSGTEIRTAPKPKELLARGLLAPTLTSMLLTSKYCSGLPFYRQVEMLERQGVELDDGTMCRYAEHIGASLGPIVDACAKEARATAFCLSTDATGVAIQPEPLPSKARQPCAKGHFFVVLADQDHVFFEYRRKQTSAAICEILKGFSGYVQADAHAIHDALFRTDERSSDEAVRTEVGCWSHCRRKFWEAATAAKEPLAREALLRIRQLFQLDEKWRKMPPSKRTRLRQQIAAPLVRAFFEWVQLHWETLKGQRGLLRSALGYAVRQKKALERFLEDGRLKMTNNHSERALRPIAVGRRNWLFFGSDDHAQAAANLFSLIASCRLHRLDPEAYLADVIRVVPCWPRERYLELAPKYWQQTRARLEIAELERQVGPISIPPVAEE